MTVAVVLIFLAIITSGMGVSFYSKLNMSVEERFFSGWIFGILTFTICGVISTRLLGFNLLGVNIAAVAALAVGAKGWLDNLDGFSADIDDFKKRLRSPVTSSQNPAVLIAFLIPVWGLIGGMFYNAYSISPDGSLISGHLASWTDWMAHLTYTASFAFSGEVDFQLPTAAGYGIGYHSGINFFAALLIPAGVSLPGALQLSGAFTLFAFPGVMYSVGVRVFKRQSIALLGTYLFMFYGGLGWRMLPQDFQSGWFNSVTRTYTRGPSEAEGHFWLENPMVGHFFPQRPTMLGFPIALLAMAWAYSAWQALEAKKDTPARRCSITDSPLTTLFFVGVLIGLTPFFNLFGFGTPLAMIMAWWVFTGFKKEWLYTIIPAIILALPVIRFLSPPSSSLKIPYSWVSQIKGTAHLERSFAASVVEWLDFWFQNTGIFLLLFIAALVLSKPLSKQIRIGLLPIWLWFIVPNASKPHPWNGNNTHYFVFILLIGALPIAALLVHLVSKHKLALIAVIPAVISMTLAGVIDVYAANGHQASPFPITALESSGMTLGQWARTTDSDSVFVIELGFGEGAASPHLHPLTAMSGRSVVVGFDGWVYDLGIPDWADRKEHSRIILEAGPGFEQLIDLYGVDYLVVGPAHRTPNWQPNIDYWNSVGKVVFSNAGWTVYEV